MFSFWTTFDTDESEVLDGLTFGMIQGTKLGRNNVTIFLQRKKMPELSFTSTKSKRDQWLVSNKNDEVKRLKSDELAELILPYLRITKDDEHGVMFVYIALKVFKSFLADPNNVSELKNQMAQAIIDFGKEFKDRKKRVLSVIDGGLKTKTS